MLSEDVRAVVSFMRLFHYVTPVGCKTELRPWQAGAPLVAHPLTQHVTTQVGEPLARVRRPWRARALDVSREEYLCTSSNSGAAGSCRRCPVRWCCWGLAR